MRTATSQFELRSANTVRDALSMLRDDPALVPLAGCTDLYVALNFGTLAGTRFLDLWPLEPLRRIAVERRHAEHRRAGHVHRHHPVASRSQAAADARASPRARSAARRSRIAGPSAATSRTRRQPATRCPCSPRRTRSSCCASASGERRVPFNEFYTGYRKSVRRPDELIVAVEIPKQTGTQWFRKVGTRAAQAISKVVMAAVRDARPRVAIGSVAATVVRLPRTEAALANAASIDRGRRARARRGDHADRRRALDRGLPPQRRGQPAAPVLGGHRRDMTLGPQLRRSCAAGAS